MCIRDSHNGNVFVVATNDFGVRIFNYSSKWINTGNINTGSFNINAPSIAINRLGNILVIGNPINSTDNNYNIEQVTIYKYENNEWTIYGNKIDSRIGGGKSLSLSEDGNILVIGSPQYNEFGGIQKYRFKNNKWIMEDEIIGYNINKQFGKNLIINNYGNTISVIDDEFLYTYNFVWCNNSL